MTTLTFSFLFNDIDVRRCFAKKMQPLYSGVEITNRKEFQVGLELKVPVDAGLE